MPAQATRNVNVRTGPGENYTVLGSLSPNSPLPVTARNGQWIAVEINGRQGWVAGWIVTLTGVCEGLPTVQAVAPVQIEQAPAQQPRRRLNPPPPPHNRPSAIPPRPNPRLSLTNPPNSRSNAA